MWPSTKKSYRPYALSVLPFSTIIKLIFIVLIMVAIFIVDTGTHYEIAVAVFYSVVLLLAAQFVKKSVLIMMSFLCIAIIVISFIISQHGHFYVGLMNTGISIVSIIMITYLIIQMENARTEAHAAQEKLLRIARANTLERLTISIAHEMNQPLTTIINSANAAQRWLSQEPIQVDKAMQAIDRILNDAARASNIMTRIRSLTRGDPPQKSYFNLNQAVTDVLTLSSSDIQRKNIRLVTELDDSLSLAYADAVQIQQVLVNLILNALDAMETNQNRAKVLTVRTYRDSDYLVISVVDTGVGIPADIYKHIFESFWTTKNDGIGVGLSISREIVDANGGHIWAQMNDGGGTVFYVTIPSQDDDIRRVR